MEVIKLEDGADILSWCPDIEEEALEQMKVLARLPFVKHCALMPDAHLGQNMPIGGVIACDNVVMPDAVGYDCGCGMGAIKTSVQKEQIEARDLREDILHSLGRGIPVGFSHNSQKRAADLSKEYGDKIKFLIDKSKVEIYSKHFNPVGNLEETITSQLGTLGGG